MIITIDIAEKIRIKRARLSMTKTKLAEKLGIARQTLAKIEQGQYKCPKRIYESVMTWLVEEI